MTASNHEPQDLGGVRIIYPQRTTVVQCMVYMKRRRWGSDVHQFSGRERSVFDLLTPAIPRSWSSSIQPDAPTQPGSCHQRQEYVIDSPRVLLSVMNA